MKKKNDLETSRLKLQKSGQLMHHGNANDIFRHQLKGRKINNKQTNKRIKGHNSGKKYIHRLYFLILSHNLQCAY